LEGGILCLNGRCRNVSLFRVKGDMNEKTNANLIIIILFETIY